MSAEGEEDITQEKDERGAVGNSVMRGEDEDTSCLLMEQHRAEERSLIGSKRCVNLFGDLLLPLGKWRCNYANGDALADDAAKMRDAVESGVNAGKEQRVALLYCVERLAPPLDGCVTGDLGCKCMVGGKVLAEETKELFKCAERTEQIAPRDFEMLTFKGGRRQVAFLF